jgi:hypothetical protein
MFDPSRNPGCPECQKIYAAQELYLKLCRDHPTSARHRAELLDDPNPLPFTEDQVRAFAGALSMSEAEARVVLARAAQESRLLH